MRISRYIKKNSNSSVPCCIQYAVYIYNCTFCRRDVVMGFLKIPLSRKNYNQNEYMEQTLIPFLLQAFLSRFYLLHNSSIETINKKKKENQIGKKMEGYLWCQAFQFKFFRWQMETTLKKGLEVPSPPSFCLTRTSPEKRKSNQISSIQNRIQKKGRSKNCSFL